MPNEEPSPADGRDFLEYQADDQVAESLTYRVGICRALLASYVVFLLFRAWQLHGSTVAPAGWALQSTADVMDVLRGLAWYEFMSLALFFVLGLLVPPASVPELISGKGSGVWSRRMNWLGLGACVTIACVWIVRGAFPGVGALLIPLLGYLVGLRLSSAWLRGGRAFAWAAGQLALVAVVCVVSMIGMARLSLEDAPLDFQPTHLSGADKHRLAQWIRDTRPNEGEPRHLRLTDTEVESILNAGVGRGHAQRKTQVRFEPNGFEATASLVLPERLADQKFLNARVSGNVAIDNGDLHLRFDRLRLGRIAVPSIVLVALSPALRDILLDDPRVRQIVGAITSLKPEEGAIETVFEPGSLGRRVVPSLAQLLWQQPDVAHQTEIYIRALVNRYNELPSHVDRFGLLMQTAFALAEQRSQENDPVLENRAAIFALAILLGHQGLEPFVGEVEDATLRQEAAPMMDVTMIRGRRDWVRHFLVSAALVLLSSEAASDRIGLLKEQLDAQDGGSGFSFGDLLADRAGTRFAAAATRDRTSAVAMQKRLAAGFEVSEFFPPADGLPEGIPDEEFRTKYGDIDGPGYRELSDEIDRRLARLPLM